MPLVVPILRLFMLFLNVFETFKTMKPPSRRRGGQPSVRAITQRKRDMKGCLAVWVVWVSHFAAAYIQDNIRIYTFSAALRRTNDYSKASFASSSRSTVK